MSPCITSAGVTVCRLPYVRTARHCGTCGRVRPMAGTFGVWYGASLTCLGCGDHWDDEALPHRSPRPFKRGWKAERIATARRMWAQANPLRMEMRRQDDEQAAYEATS